MPTREAAALSARFGLAPQELTPRVQLALALLAEETDALRAALSAAEQEAERDPLTGALNRRGFLKALARALAMLGRHDSPSALLFVDLDGFKALNDTRGHAAGDAALMHVAGLFQAHLRLEDHLARIGGDEFVILLTHADHCQAEAKAQALANLLASQQFEHEGVRHTLSAAIGAAALSSDEGAEQALARADEAMYAAKRAAKRRAELAALGVSAA